jgi:hypothetical protein
MANAAGWQPDPDDADQERYWSGTDWTDDVRPSAEVRSFGGTGATVAHGAPDHIPQLHRALSAAAADLDAMEDRISTLFDRRDDAPARTTSGAGTVVAAPAETEVVSAGMTDDDIIDIFGEGDVAWTEDDAHVAIAPGDSRVADRMAIISQYEEDIGGAFSDLDAELAAETPDDNGKDTRRRFGRRAKGTASAKRSS